MLFRYVPVFLLFLTLWSSDALASTSSAWECAPEIFHNVLIQDYGDAGPSKNMLINRRVIKDEYAGTEQIYFHIGDITSYYRGGMKSYGRRLGQHVMLLLDEGNGKIGLGAGIYIQTGRPVFDWVLRNKKGQTFPVSIERSDVSSRDDSTRRWKYWLTAMFPKDYQLDSASLRLRLDAQDGEGEQFEFELMDYEVLETIACIKGKKKL